jgi:hypothetical protein
MRKPNGRPGPLFLVAACAALFVGCSEEYADQSFGVLDLASTYPGGTPESPAAGVPSQISPQHGYLDEAPAEYYDFGKVPVRVNLLTGVPQAALIQPMYFFFNTRGFPLFSTSVREHRDGTDWMRGGKGVLNPNPKDFCAGVAPEDQAKNSCAKRRDIEKKKPYPARYRELFVDANRHVADYQRPIIDVTPDDSSVSAKRHYTGLWEIIEVTVPDDYAPDSVKHKATLDRAVAAGKFRARRTGKVINCPMIDERSLVSRGIGDRANPHPRIELWYRRQLAFCYLANGWETLGNDQGQLLFSNSDSDRVDTFDVAHLSVGVGTLKSDELFVPIGKAYVPVVLTSDQSENNLPSLTHIVDNVITTGRPKHVRGDPPGYTPIRWMWDFRVSDDYAAGGLKSVAAVDPSITMPLGAFQNADPTVHNFPLRGIPPACGYPKLEGFNQCGRRIQDPAMPDNPNAMITDARDDPECTKSGLECNKDTCYCEAPFVGYGQACGPGIAQCSPDKDAFSEVGYLCFPPSGGFCYLKCDTSKPNARASENTGKKPTEAVDTRCNGLTGYACLGTGTGPICLKLCDTNVTATNQCSTTATLETDPEDIGKEQLCQDLGLEVCTWPDSYTGR